MLGLYECHGASVKALVITVAVARSFDMPHLYAVVSKSHRSVDE